MDAAVRNAKASLYRHTLVIQTAVYVVQKYLSLALLLYAAKRRSYQIFCHQLDGRTITLNVSVTDTIGDVKTKIAQKCDFPAKHQLLVYSGKALDDSRCVHQYDIQPESTVHIRSRLRGAGLKSTSNSSGSQFNAEGNSASGAHTEQSAWRRALAELWKVEAAKKAEEADYGIQQESTVHIDSPLRGAGEVAHARQLHSLAPAACCMHSHATKYAPQRRLPL